MDTARLQRRFAEANGTVFRARPDERLRELVLMPAEQAQRALVETVKTVRRRARRLASRVIRGQ